ncbi:MAG: hypothetical protein MJZ25_02450 [Fibrobacter sp.]|nr:hypothetical protein [Fibrobacter sp.]
MSKAITGHRYRHYKKETMVYTVVEANALDCEDVKPLVIYRSEVILPDGTVADRFTEIDLL